MTKPTRDLIKMFNEVVNHATDLTGYDIRGEGWSLSMNNRKTSLGLCDYGKKSIQISRHFKDSPNILNTMRHEVAHAYTQGDAHGKRWKKLFMALGGTGERCANVAEQHRPKHSWELVDGTTKTVVAKFHRKPRRDYSKFMVRGRPETMGELFLRRV